MYRIVLMVAAALAAWSQTPEKKWRGIGEHQLFTAIAAEADIAKRLGLLDLWTRQYGDSDFRKERLHLYIATYQAFGRLASVFEYAKEVLSLDASDGTGLYWAATLAPNLIERTKSNLEQVEQWANRLLAASKPAASSVDWDAAAYTTLGWVAMERGEDAKAESEFLQSLNKKAEAGQVSLWLGLTLQRNPDRQAEAVFHLARAAMLSGSGGLPLGERQHADVLFQKAFAKWRGDDRAAMAEVRRMARTRALPPADFKLPGATRKTKRLP